MKTLTGLEDLRRYGIFARSVATCELGYRHVCQLDERGRKIVAKALGLTPAIANRPTWRWPWRATAPMATIQVPPQLHVPLSVFALLDDDCTEVWITSSGDVYGVEPSDTTDVVNRSWVAVRRNVVRTLQAPRSGRLLTATSDDGVVVDEFATVYKNESRSSARLT